MTGWLALAFVAVLVLLGICLAVLLLDPYDPEDDQW